VFYSVKLVSIALLLAVGFSHTHTHTTPQETNSITEGNATYKDFTKLDEWRFLLARINRANSHWSLSLPPHTTYYIWTGEEKHKHCCQVNSDHHVGDIFGGWGALLPRAFLHRVHRVVTAFWRMFSLEGKIRPGC
jgi:hypothetical protein